MDKNRRKIAIAMSPHKSLRDFTGQADGRKKRIAVAMSGGVDSAVAAKLLKDRGHEVVGIFLHFWQEDIKSLPLDKRGRGDFENKCCSNQALADARRVAAKIGIPLYTLNFSKIFKKQVVDNFLAEYGRGRTANPCVRCNKLVKLGFLIKQARRLGFDCVATGHYVRNVECRMSNVEFKYKLLKAKDKAKDQSYFLYTLSQNELKHLLFPLGNYTKPQVRQMAVRFKLPVAEKKESQEICFIPEKNHNEFLKRHLKLKPGLIEIIPLDKGGRRGIKQFGKNTIPPPIRRAGLTPFIKGAVVGRHQGLPLYTIGQRKGIKIGGTGPYYAAKMDYKKNTLYVVNDSHHPFIYQNWLIAKNVNWLAGASPRLPLKCQAVIRYHHQPAKAVVTKVNVQPATSRHIGRQVKPGPAGVKVKFFKPQRAITPGQSVVFYHGQEMLGGGVIC